MFPGAGSSVYHNDAGEVLGWDNHFYDEGPYEPDDYLPDYDDPGYDDHYDDDE